MANITKMFIHYDHTVAEFKAAGFESTYANSIVFISGAGSDEKPCIYTHNNYYGNVQDALNALNYFQTQVYNKRSYIKGVKVGDTTFVAPDNGQGAIIPFVSLDPSTVTVDAVSGTITIGLKEEFVRKVNTTATNLGTTTDASTVSTAFGRIARLDAVLDNLMNGEEGIETIIKDYINTNLTLDKALDSSSNGFSVSINQKNGKINNLTVTAPDVSTIADGKITTAIEDLDSSAKDSSNGFSVYVELKDGKLLPDGVGVKVTAPDVSTIVDDKISDAIALLDSEKYDTDNGIYVKVTEVDGKIDIVDVSAADLVKNYKADISTAIADLDSTKDDTDNGIAVKVTQADGKITGVTVDASGMSKKADLDVNGKIVAEQLPDYILGQVLFGGTVDGAGKVTASDSYKVKYGDTTVVPDASTAEGAYFIATGSGELSGIDYTPTTLEYTTGDWIISTGTEWVKIDNTDAVSSVAGLTGAVTATDLAAELSKDGLVNELALKSEVDAVDARIDDLDATLDASSNGVRVAFKQEDGLVKDLVVEGPDVDGKISAAIDDLNSSANDTDNGIYVKVTEENGKITDVDVSASELVANYKEDISDAIDALDASVTSASVNGVQVRVEQTDGKVSAVTVVSAPDVDGKISAAIDDLNSSANDNDNGVKVSVEQTNGKISSVDVQTTIADTSVAGSAGLVNNAGLQWMFEWLEL